MNQEKSLYMIPFIPFVAADGIGDLCSSAPLSIAWGAAQIVLAALLSFLGYQGLKGIRQNKRDQEGKP